MPTDLQLATSECSRLKLESRFKRERLYSPDLKFSSFLRETVIRQELIKPYEQRLLVNYDGSVGLVGYINKMYSREYGYWPTIDFVPVMYGVDFRFKKTGTLAVVPNGWFDEVRVNLTKMNLRLSQFFVRGTQDMNWFSEHPFNNRVLSAKKNVAAYIPV